MKSLFLNNRIVFGFYALLIIAVSFYLLSYGKVQIHLYMNQMVGNKATDLFFYYITYLGDGAMSPVLLLPVFFYNIRLGITCTMAFLAAALATSVLKHFFFDNVDRPWFVFQWYVKSPLKYVGTDYLHIHNSFPSGHSTQAFAIFIGLALFVKNHLYKFLFLLVAILAAFSRVYLSQHWLVDVTAGSIIGTISATLMFYLLIIKNRYPSLDKPLLKNRSV